MSAPVIGITTYPRNAEGRVTLPAQYVEGIRRAGGLPWLIPPGEPRWRDVLARIDALILPGGGDVAPELYGGDEHPAVYGVDRERDGLEIDLVRALAAGEKPLLGICRGAQVVNVALGGTLIEHLPDGAGARVPHRGGGPGTSALHRVEVAPGSRLAEIVGAAPSCSSSHHQAIRALAPGLSVVARAADGTIEAVESPSLPFFLAVQWHPEHTADRDAAQQRLFDALVDAARIATGRLSG